LILQIIVPTQSGSYICYSTVVNVVVPSGPSQQHVLFIHFYAIYKGFLMSSMRLM